MANPIAYHDAERRSPLSTETDPTVVGWCRYVAKILIKLAICEPGENWVGETLNGVAFELPKEWANDLPNHGIVTTTYFVEPQQQAWNVRQHFAEILGNNSDSLFELNGISEAKLQPYMFNVGDNMLQGGDHMYDMSVGGDHLSVAEKEHRVLEIMLEVLTDTNVLQYDTHEQSYLQLSGERANVATVQETAELLVEASFSAGEIETIAESENWTDTKLSNVLSVCHMARDIQRASKHVEATPLDSGADAASIFAK